MIALLKSLENLFGTIPLPIMEVWGRVSYIFGLIIAIAAFGGLTFLPGGRWGIGRQQHSWDSKAFFSLIITFVSVIVCGYLGSTIVLVPQAQTFETLKDVAVFVCILIFGYPALLIVPVAYGISDLIEGIPPGLIMKWIEGYFINPACFWIGYQFIGKNPDFRKAKTWEWYFLFILIFMATAPFLWGYICSPEFTPEISYRNITAALFLTTSITWLISPLVMLAALPLAKKFEMFWAEVPGHVSEKKIRNKQRVWVSGGKGNVLQGISIRMFIATPFVSLILLMVSSTAYLTMKYAEKQALKLASHLHREISNQMNLTPQLNTSTALKRELVLHKVSMGRAILVYKNNEIISSSEEPKDVPSQLAVEKLREQVPKIESLTTPVQFRFNVVTARPLRHEGWLAQATPHGRAAQNPSVLITAIPESFYLSGIRTGGTQSAMLFALFLTASLLMAALISTFVAAPIRHLVNATRAIAQGNLHQKVPMSRLTEVVVLSNSFNGMTRELDRVYHELQTARDIAETSSKTKSEFIDITAHELRTPITTMSLLIQLLQQQINEGKELDAKFIEKISHELKRLNVLVEELLNISRLDRGTMSINTTQFDLSQLVSESVEDYCRQTPHRKISFKSTDQSIYVNADPIRIQQVIFNLIDNAIKYTPPESSIEVILTADESTVKLSVVDHGDGIEPEQQKRLFSKFYRTESESRLKKPGLGLGLYICKKIIELHHGEIGVENTDSHGCTFYFTLARAIAREGGSKKAA